MGERTHETISKAEASASQPAFTPSIVSKLLRERLALLEKGDEVSLEELARIAGFDGDDWRGETIRAAYAQRRAMRRDHGAVLRLDASRGATAIRRLTDGEIATERAAGERRKKIRSQAREGRKEMRTVDPAALTDDERRSLVAHVVLFEGTHKQSTNKRTMKLAEPGDTGSWFKKRIEKKDT